MLGSRVFEILDGQLDGCPVLSSPLVNSTVYQMERTGAFYPVAHTDPVEMAKLGAAIHTLFGFQGVRVPFDLCVEAEALGCEVRMGGNPPAPYVSRPREGPLEAFPIPEDLFERGRLPVVFEALRLLQERYADRIPIYAGLTGPFTLGGYVFGAEGFLKLVFRDPQRLESLLDWLGILVEEYARRLLEAGSSVIAVMDPLASGNMISPRVFERFVMPVYLRLRKKIQQRIILHICGDTLGLLRFIPETGFSGFSFEGPAVAAEDAREVIGKRMALIGNIPTSKALLFGNPERVKKEVRNALAGGIHLLAPACAIPPGTPPENLRAMRTAWEEHTAFAQ